MKKLIIISILVALFFILTACGDSMPQGTFYPVIGGELQTGPTMSTFEFRGRGNVTSHMPGMSISMFYRIDGNRLIISESRRGVGLEYILSNNNHTFTQDFGLGMIPGMQDFSPSWSLLE